MNHQIHFGKQFYLDKKTGYWISSRYSKDDPRIRAHQWVWINNHGKIPKGYHIHHKNDDKSDNRIENLELIHKSRHLSHHMQCPERKRMARENAEKIRPLTKAWHRSEEGLAWHKAHGILGWINREPVEVECKMCRKKAKTKIYHQEFCSNACKSRWRRKEGLDNIEQECVYCNSKFVSNKYSKASTCSRSCAAKQRWMKRK